MMVFRFVICLEFNLILVLCQVWLEGASVMFVVNLTPHIV